MPEPGGKVLRVPRKSGATQPLRGLALALRHGDDLLLGKRLVPEAQEQDVGGREFNVPGACPAVIEDVLVEQQLQPGERNAKDVGSFLLAVKLFVFQDWTVGLSIHWVTPPAVSRTVYCLYPVSSLLRIR